MNSYYDKELDEEGIRAKNIIHGVVRTCDNCLEATPDNPFPIFQPKSWNYDPHHEDVQCLFCDSYNTEPSTEEGLKDYWRCKDCGEKFFINLSD